VSFTVEAEIFLHGGRARAVRFPGPVRGFSFVYPSVI
jgi:hypothetical protein